MPDFPFLRETCVCQLVLCIAHGRMDGTCIGLRLGQLSVIFREAICDLGLTMADV